MLWGPLLAEVLLIGAVLRLYVRVGFFVTVGDPKETTEDGVYVAGAGDTSGCTVSYRAGAKYVVPIGVGSGAGSGFGDAASTGVTSAGSDGVEVTSTGARYGASATGSTVGE